jgi:hypothetical protein
MQPDTQYGTDLNVMERYGLDLLRRSCDRDETDVHTWSQHELAEIRRLERGTLAFAALSGTISGTIIAAIELWLRAWLVDDMETAGWRELVSYWGAYLLLAGIVTGIEIAYLYWLVLRNVARVSAVAGLSFADESPEQVMATGLSRAALDMPNPQGALYGIDPYAHVSRWQLRLYSIVYRAKVGVTSLMLRLLLRRILARAALRFMIPFVAIPIYAVWNALIVHWIMREARVRAAGPVTVAELAERVAAVRDDLDTEQRRLLVELVGVAMISARDAHPNFVLLLNRLFEDLDLEPHSILVDWDVSRRRLSGLEPHIQQHALDLLTVAAVLGGRPGRRQKRLLEEAYRASGRPFRDEHVDAVYRAFIEGQGSGGL